MKAEPTERRRISLSDFFPKNTAYFYGFPTGEDSEFYNQVPTYDEELVSARPLICAGDNVKVVTYAGSSEEYSLNVISKYTSHINRDNIIRLSKDISPKVTGNTRNHLVKQSLGSSVDEQSLVMAQPFLDDKLSSKFMIKPELSAVLSSKNNMQLFVPSRFVPGVHGTYKSGKSFKSSKIVYKLPCVVKVANSSSGDGVIICFSQEDVDNARQKFSGLRSTIFVEEFIEVKHNLCVQFGIPQNSDEEPCIIGYNEQLTSGNGDFLGGVVNARKDIPKFDEVCGVLLDELLPALRDLGWYGIGGIDVLIRPDGKFYFIDPNLRLTATYAYVYLTSSRAVRKPIISFTGKISCSKKEFESKILSLAAGANPSITIISLSNHDNTFRFNAGIQFESIEEMREKANKLLEIGVEATVLNNISNGSIDYDLA